MRCQRTLSYALRTLARIRVRPTVTLLPNQIGAHHRERNHKAATVSLRPSNPARRLDTARRQTAHIEPRQVLVEDGHAGRSPRRATTSPLPPLRFARSARRQWQAKWIVCSASVDHSRPRPEQGSPPSRRDRRSNLHNAPAQAPRVIDGATHCRTGGHTPA